MNNKPTPETDAAWAAESGNGLNEVREISRKLERERDDYKWQLHIATGAFEQARQMERAWRKEETNDDHE
jgi:hypothetical protein